MSRSGRRLLDRPQPIINRYFRLMTHRWLIAKVRALVRLQARPRLKWMERKRRKALASALDVMAAEACRARRLGLNETTIVLNLGLFFLVAERDIQSVKIDALTHPDAWTRGLAARVILLTIHELDIDKVAGNSLRLALDNTSVPIELRNEMTDALRQVRKAQARARQSFAYLRNSTIAHRDPDAIRQHRDILEIDGLQVIKVAGEFYAGAEKFMNVMPRLIEYMGAPPVVIAQLVSKAQAGAPESKKSRNAA